jgi:predicted SprT family Zn-dependent metalloprotease
MTELFDYFCKNCKEKTIHTISKVLRSRGVKIICLKCREENSKYLNLKSLQKFKHIIQEAQENEP